MIDITATARITVVVNASSVPPTPVMTVGTCTLVRIRATRT